MNSPFSAIVHTRPARKVSNLIAFAEDTASLVPISERFLLLTPDDPDVTPTTLELAARTGRYPASAIFPYLTDIVSAAGFNIVREVQALNTQTKISIRHHLLPCERQQMTSSRSRQTRESPSRQSIY
jgi:hypothetical protein